MPKHDARMLLSSLLAMGGEMPMLGVKPRNRTKHAHGTSYNGAFYAKCGEKVNRLMLTSLPEGVTCRHCNEMSDV